MNWPLEGARNVYQTEVPQLGPLLSAGQVLACEEFVGFGSPGSTVASTFVLEMSVPTVSGIAAANASLAGAAAADAGTRRSPPTPPAAR